MSARVTTFVGAAIAAVGIMLVWLVRSRGGVCVDGAYDTGEFYGYCLDWDSATGALPATIVIGMLLVASFIVRQRRVRWVLIAVMAVVAIVGAIVNVTVIDYPDACPG